MMQYIGLDLDIDLMKVSLSLQEIRRCGLKVAVAGISKTIDNDIPVRLFPQWFEDFYFRILLLIRS